MCKSKSAKGSRTTIRIRRVERWQHEAASVICMHGVVLLEIVKHFVKAGIKRRAHLEAAREISLAIIGMIQRMVEG